MHFPFGRTRVVSNVESNMWARAPISQTYLAGIICARSQSECQRLKCSHMQCDTKSQSNENEHHRRRQIYAIYVLEGERDMDAAMKRRLWPASIFRNDALKMCDGDRFMNIPFGTFAPPASAFACIASAFRTQFNLMRCDTMRNVNVISKTQIAVSKRDERDCMEKIIFSKCLTIISK